MIKKQINTSLNLGFLWFFFLISSSSVSADNGLRSLLKNVRSYGDLFSTQEIAGLNVSIWAPKNKEKYPLIIFSHGFRGCSTQSSFLTETLAEDGYIIVAPNHKDSACSSVKPEGRFHEFREPDNWDDTSYNERKDDIQNLIQALHTSSLNDQIDWEKVALMGHSLGGYTTLALAGGWSSWKLKGIKAVLAFSPYCAPFLKNGDLKNISVPVMYQGGTLDFGISPSVKKDTGCFNQTSESFYAELDGAGHFAWADIGRNKENIRDNIKYYSKSFFDAYLKGMDKAKILVKQSGITELLHH